MAVVQRYCFHLLCATLGSAIGAFFISWWLGPLFKGAMVPAAVICGGVLGYVVNKKMMHLSASFVWILPAIWLVRGILDAAKSFSPGWAGTNLSSYIWDNFLGPHCGATECLNELVFTVPCVAAIAYSTSACFAWLKARNNAALKHSV